MTILRFHPQSADDKLKADQLNEQVKAALMELRRTFKTRYQPKRMRFISEGMRSIEALRGNTYALLNDQSAALDTINQMMQGFLGQGDDPQLYAHNDNIYQAFCMILIAALMVDLGGIIWQPVDAQDEDDIQISKKGTTISGYNDRLNDVASLQQLELLYLWLFGCYFCYVRYVIDEEAGTTKQNQVGIVPVKVSEDSYRCPDCGSDTPDEQGLNSIFGDNANPNCQNCGKSLSQADWYEGQSMDMPQVIGQSEVTNGMTKYDIFSGLVVDVNPDCIINPIKETEIIDCTIEIAAAKIRAAYPDRYAEITPGRGTDTASGGDMGATARAGQTTPGSNNRPIVLEGNVSYSRCWIKRETFYELEDKELADELVKRYPLGCKLVLTNDETFLDAKSEDGTKRWTWCGTFKGSGSYPPAIGKPALDVQERVTGNVNRVDAYADRVAYGTMLYDADYIDGNAIQNKVLTPGNLTGVSRTDEETGQRVPLDQLFHQMTFQIDSEIWHYADTLTTRAQFLVGVMPQVFGGSDKNVQTAEGQEQALNTALGRLKQYLNQMRGERARRAKLSVLCSVENADEEIKIVQQNEGGDGWETISMLKSELGGNFFTYPEDTEGFPATYTEEQARIQQLLAENQKLPFVSQMLADPDVANEVAHYVLPKGMELSSEPERAKIKTILTRLLQDPNGPITKPNPAFNPSDPSSPKVVVTPTILPDFRIDDPPGLHDSCKEMPAKELGAAGIKSQRIQQCTGVLGRFRADGKGASG